MRRIMLLAMLPSLMIGAIAHAEEMVSNLDNTVGVNVLGVLGLGDDTYLSIAGSFTTGPSASTLESVRLSLDETSGIDPLIVSIYSNSGTAPGTSLATLSGPANPSDGLFDYVGSLSLAASSTYWVVLSVENGPTVNTSYAWRVTPDYSDTSPAGWSIANGFAGSSSDNPDWEFVGDADFAPLFSVTAVPEPSSIALAAMSLFGLLAVARRRRSHG